MPKQRDAKCINKCFLDKREIYNINLDKFFNAIKFPTVHIFGDTRYNSGFIEPFSFVSTLSYHVIAIRPFNILFKNERDRALEKKWLLNLEFRAKAEITNQSNFLK